MARQAVPHGLNGKSVYTPSRARPVSTLLALVLVLCAVNSAAGAQDAASSYCVSPSIGLCNTGSDIEFMVSKRIELLFRALLHARCLNSLPRIVPAQLTCVTLSIT